MQSKSSKHSAPFSQPGHPAGDFVESPKWKTLKSEPGLVEIDAHLPEQVLNPRRQLFGGFTGTYVDMISIHTARTVLLDDKHSGWTTTVNMRIDYLEPVVGPRFIMRGELIKNGRTTCLVASHFLDHEGNVLVYAITTLRKLD